MLFGIWQNWLYSSKVVAIGQSGCFRAKLVVFGEIVVVFGQKSLYLGKIGCFRSKVVVFGQKLLYSGKSCIFGQICL